MKLFRKHNHQILACALGAVFAFFPSASAQAFTDNESLDAWIRLYYQNPKPEKLDQALLFYVSSPAFAEAQSQPPMAQFLGTALRNEPERMEALFASYYAKGKTDLEKFLLVCLWTGDSKTGRALLRRARKNTDNEALRETIQSLLKTKPKNFKRELPESTSEVEQILSAFYASGDTDYVQALIGAMELVGAANLEGFVGRAAFNALADLALKHDRALDYCKQRLPRTKGPSRATLARLIGHVESLRSLPSEH